MKIETILRTLRAHDNPPCSLESAMLRIARSATNDFAAAEWVSWAQRHIASEARARAREARARVWTRKGVDSEARALARAHEIARERAAAMVEALRAIRSPDERENAIRKVTQILQEELEVKDERHNSSNATTHV